MASMNISLPEVLKRYVEEQVSHGSYGTASEYFRELIREDRKRRGQERLEALLVEGLDSGPSVQVTPQFWEALWARADTSVRERQPERLSEPGA